MRMAQAAPLHAMQLPVREPTTGSGTIWEYENSTGAGPSHQAASQILLRSPPIPTLTNRDLSLDGRIPKKNPGSSSDSMPRKWRAFPSRARKPEPGVASESFTSGHIHESELNDHLLGSPYKETVSSMGKSSPRHSSRHSVSPEDLADDASSPWKMSSEMSIDEVNPWREEPSTLNCGIKKAASPEISSVTRKLSYMPRTHSTEAALVEDPPKPSQEPKPMRRIAPYKPRTRLMSEALPLVESGTPPDTKGTQKKFSFMHRRRTTPDVPRNATPPQTHNLNPTVSPIVSRTRTDSSALLGSSNPYGGYCKGAYKLQVGLDKESVNLRNQSTSYVFSAFHISLFRSNFESRGMSWDFPPGRLVSRLTIPLQIGNTDSDIIQHDWRVQLLGLRL